MAKKRSIETQDHSRVTSPPVVETAPPSRCPKCGDAGRTTYYGTQVQQHAGLRPDGSEYRQIIRRRCRCTTCGQVRIDKDYR